VTSTVSVLRLHAAVQSGRTADPHFPLTRERLRSWTQSPAWNGLDRILAQLGSLSVDVAGVELGQVLLERQRIWKERGVELGEGGASFALEAQRWIARATHEAELGRVHELAPREPELDAAARRRAALENDRLQATRLRADQETRERSRGRGGRA
jgi:hypothetical protein